MAAIGPNAINANINLDDLLPPEYPEDKSATLDEPMEMGYLMDISGSTGNIFVRTELDIPVSIFQNFAYFGKAIAVPIANTDPDGMDLIVFSAPKKEGDKGYRMYKNLTAEKVQDKFSDGSINPGGATHISSPLQAMVDRIVGKLEKNFKKTGEKMKGGIIVASDGCPSHPDTEKKIKKVVVDAIKRLQAIGYQDDEFGFSFVGIKPERVTDISNDWKSRQQTATGWKKELEKAADFYRHLDDDLEKEVGGDWVDFKFLEDAARMGATQFVDGMLND